MTVPTSRMPLLLSTGERFLRRHWGLLCAAGLLALALRNFAALASVPRGFYQDEAAIGYDGWAIAHYSTDEHGVHLPLFFESFQDYKNPVYIYAVAAVTRFLPLTITTARVPAAVFGALAVLLLAATAWKLTRSYTITVVTFLVAGMTPWLMLESRVAFEVISLVCAISAALYCLAAAQSSRPRLHYFLAGCALMVGTFTYSPARLQIAIFAAVLCAAFGLSQHRRGSWWLALVPVAAGYAILFDWSEAHPGALTGRFQYLSVFNHTNVLFGFGHFVLNYLLYIPSPEFLPLWGDLNWRHNIHFGGMLLVVTIPLLIIGAKACLRRFDEPLRRFILVGFLASPIAAALTGEGTPHALRAAAMLPFSIALTIYGAEALLARTRSPESERRLATWGTAALLINGLGANLWMFTAYPVIAATPFQDGTIAALQAGHKAAGSHTMYITDSAGIEYSFPLFAFQPPPSVTGGANDVTRLLASVHVVELPAKATPELQSGDVLVTASSGHVSIPARVIFSTDLLRVYLVS
ncbi:MAG: hypothetical protein ACHQ0J_01725 [Candidatus Dormibacterales bacterium]